MRKRFIEATSAKNFKYVHMYVKKGFDFDSQDLIEVRVNLVHSVTDLKKCSMED